MQGHNILLPSTFFVDISVMGSKTKVKKSKKGLIICGLLCLTEQWWQTIRKCWIGGKFVKNLTNTHLYIWHFEWTLKTRSWGQGGCMFCSLWTVSCTNVYPNRTFSQQKLGNKVRVAEILNIIEVRMFW